MVDRQEQIDEAAKRAYMRYIEVNPHARKEWAKTWEMAPIAVQNDFRDVAEAAQLPIAEPTREEVARIWDIIPPAGEYIADICAAFVSMRNALPKPDLRERIAREIRQFSIRDASELAIADRILAIVKEQK